MDTIYKLTDENMRTYNGLQWEIGKTRTTSGQGELGGPGWLHAYTDPLLAVLLNPAHADFKAPRLFRGDGEIGATDYGLRIGCTSITLQEELPLPVVTTEQRVKFAIYCALEVCTNQEFQAWATAWLSGKNRSYAAARAAADAADAYADYAAARAAADARAAAYAAARAAAYAAYAAYAAARAAAYAAYAAAARKPLNLVQIAKKAMED